MLKTVHIAQSMFFNFLTSVGHWAGGPSNADLNRPSSWKSQVWLRDQYSAVDSSYILRHLQKDTEPNSIILNSVGHIFTIQTIQTLLNAVLVRGSGPIPLFIIYFKIFAENHEDFVKNGELLDPWKWQNIW